MINEFIDFYNDERSIFAKEAGEFLSLNVELTMKLISMDI